MTAVLDPFVLEHAPGPVVALNPAIERLRDAVRATVDDLGSIADDRLTSLWLWDGNEINVRYGFYNALEIIERATSEVGRAVASVASSEARDAIGATTAARWDLDGILAGMTDEDLDADPGGEEWTMRQTLGHIIGSQRGYAWGNAYWLSTRDEPRAPGPQRAPEGLFEAMPSDDDEARGSLADVRRSLHDVVDSTSSRYATLTTEEMAVMGGWYGFPVSIGFRLWRCPSHIEEHTVQVEKTIDLLGRRQTEVARLVRLVLRAYGRLEQLVIGRGADELRTAGVDEALDRVAGALEELGPSVRAAATAGLPGPPD